MRFLTATAICALTAGAATAQIVAEPHLYTVGDTEFEGYVAYNSDLEETKGTILIVHDWDGLTDYEMRRAEMLAALGYTAFAIDVYGADVEPEGFEDYRRLSGEMYSDRETFRERLLGAVEESAAIPGATENKAMIGYCFGGAAVLEAARAGADLDAFVSFHGGLGTPEGQEPGGASAPDQCSFFTAARSGVGHGRSCPGAEQLQEAASQWRPKSFGGATAFLAQLGLTNYLRGRQVALEGLQAFLKRGRL